MYPKWKVDKTQLKHDVVITTRGGSWVRYPRNQVIKRLVLELWYMGFVLKSGLVKSDKYDLVVSIYPPVFFGFVSRLFLKSRSKHLIICLDIQGILAELPGTFVRRLIGKFIRFIEKKIYKKAHRIVFLSKDMRNFCVQKYLIPIERTAVCYPFEDISTQFRTDALKFFEGINKRVVYSGALGEKQAPSKIMKLFNKLTSLDPDIHCLVFSSGPLFEKLKRRNVNERILFMELVPQENLRELIEKSHIQLIPQEVGSGNAVLPSKLPNILSAGCGIVAITNKGNELAKILKNVQNAKIFYEWEYQDIALGILDLASDTSVSSKIKNDVSAFDVQKIIDVIDEL